MADLQAWENSVLGKVLDTDGLPKDKGQCSQVPISWAEDIFPGVTWAALLPEATYVEEWAGKSTKYFAWIANNPSDKNQLPLPGDILIFGATPAKGYTMTYENPGGHAAVCKSASISGYTIVEQNEPLGSGVHDGSFAWTLRPCLGWFRAINTIVSTPAPAPVAPHPAAAPVMSVNVDKQLVFPSSVHSWWVYNVGGPYDQAHHTHVLTKAAGLSYPIKRDLGNGLYVITTHDYGDVAVWGTAPLTIR